MKKLSNFLFVLSHKLWQYNFNKASGVVIIAAIEAHHKAVMDKERVMNKIPMKNAYRKTFVTGYHHPDWQPKVDYIPLMVFLGAILGTVGYLILINVQF
jgi:hypothetical protein